MKYPPLMPNCLKWEQNFESFGFLVENHIARTAVYFQNLFRRPGFLNAEIKTAWAGLSEEARLHLLIDPDAAEIIFAAKEDPAAAAVAGLNRQLEDLMAAILKSFESNYRHPRNLEWASRPALQTANGLRIDASGMLHSLGNPKIQAPTHQQTEFYLGQINKAMAVIAEVSPEALSLIETFTSNIHLRENPHHPNYSSWSTHIGIGKITASNFGQVAGDLAEVVDFLIHESIHNFLHLVEEQYGPFLEIEAYAAPWIKEKIVPSPWSGKKIDLGSYTHAIAVWYGLARFWIKAKSYGGAHAGELSPARIGKMIAQACAGFVKERNVHLAAEERFNFINKDFLSFSLGFQNEISYYWKEARLA